MILTIGILIYEMHVGGFTRNPNSMIELQKRGTYTGLIEKIPYLVDLGITAVELLPVFQFDEQDCPNGLVNYWGYSPVSFFAPHHSYSSSKDPLYILDEFRDMVKALHKAGIEVILDVVFNHTAKAITKVQPFVIVELITAFITCLKMTKLITPTIQALAIHLTRISLLFGE